MTQSDMYDFLIDIVPRGEYRMTEYTGDMSHTAATSVGVGDGIMPCCCFLQVEWMCVV